MTDKYRESFGPIYRWLTRCGDAISPAGKLVLMHLLERLGENATAWPGQKNIADSLGYKSEQPIRVALRELERFGAIRTRRRGQGKTNEYAPNIALLRSLAKNGISYRSCGADSTVLEPQRGNPRTVEIHGLEPHTTLHEDPSRQEPSLKLPKFEDPPPRDAGGDGLSKEECDDLFEIGFDNGAIRDYEKVYGAVTIREILAQLYDTWNPKEDFVGGRYQWKKAAAAQGVRNPAGVFASRIKRNGEPALPRPDIA